MKIFSRISPRSTNYPDTYGYSFGKAESEGEDSYRDSTDSLFEDFLNVLPQIDDGHFIVIGRKGSGKSAIAKYIKDNAVANENLFCEIVKTDIIDLEKQIQECLPSQDRQLVSLFEWIILVKLVKLILETCNGTYTREIKSLHSFMRNNAGVVEVDQFTISEVNTLSKTDINYGSLSRCFGVIVERVLGKRLEKAPFYKVLPALKEIVFRVLNFEVLKDSEFVILFDDLDINFNANNADDKSSLLNLIRTAKDINNDFRTRGIKNSKVLIFLRDDIQKVLEGYASDTSKIFSSYKVELKWFENNKARETDIALRRFINKRIALNFKRNGVPCNAADPWCTLISNAESCYGGKTAFKYILDYTFYRPRDFILFCNNIGSERFYMPIKGPNVKTLIQKYTSDNIKELKDELTILFSQEQVNDIFNILRELAPKTYSGFTREDIINKLQDKAIDISAVNNLIEYSIIIPFDTKTGNLYIRYREVDYTEFNIDNTNIKYKLHKCLIAYYNPDSIKIGD